MNFRDTIERLLWTCVAAASSSIAGAAAFGVETWKAAAMAAITAAVTYITLVARARLAALPDPGDGLPGLPVYEEG